jgi:UDP-N-acetylglucosamine 1-carboxyvinyltransferase
MSRLIIKGGNKLTGSIKVSGAKNVAMKVILAGLLTNGKIEVKNIPLISSVKGTADIVRKLGIDVKINNNHTLTITGGRIKDYVVPLELGGFYRTATMVIGPLLARFGKAVVPNPGGCRIGKRPIERHIEGLKAMGAKIKYKEGYFICQAEGLHGTNYRFNANTHTGTETMILAAVLTRGKTVIENAAEEPEIDNLILLLNQMGAEIRRVKARTIVISGVKSLNGASFEIMPDRNEAVTFAIAAYVTGGDLVVEGTQREYLKSFLAKLDKMNAPWEPIDDKKTRFFGGKHLKACSVETAIFPGFMTDWQAPWTLLATCASGTSVVHETVYEDRFGFVNEMLKMGAKIDYFNPSIANPAGFYNFNWSDRQKGSFQAIKIHGPTPLHNAIIEVSDLRAGATLLLAALKAKGESIMSGVEHIDRGYESLETRLNKLGADIRRIDY